MWPNSQFPVDSVIFTEEIPNGNFIPCGMSLPAQQTNTCSKPTIKIPEQCVKSV